MSVDMEREGAEAMGRAETVREDLEERRATEEGEGDGDGEVVEGASEEGTERHYRLGLVAFARAHSAYERALVWRRKRRQESKMLRCKKLNPTGVSLKARWGLGVARARCSGCGMVESAWDPDYEAQDWRERMRRSYFTGQLHDYYVCYRCTGWTETEFRTWHTRRMAEHLACSLLWWECAHRAEEEEAGTGVPAGSVELWWLEEGKRLVRENWEWLDVIRLREGWEKRVRGRTSLPMEYRDAGREHLAEYEEAKEAVRSFLAELTSEAWGRPFWAKASRSGPSLVKPAAASGGRSEGSGGKAWGKEEGEGEE